MIKNLFISFYIPTTLLILIYGSCHPKVQKATRPNILYIMSDDHAFQAISAYGGTLAKLAPTPNIDRLAKEGALFTRATVTNSICAPSRAVLLTGKHSFINGKVDNVQPFDWNQPNFPKIMQANGYQTAMIGKIHLDGIPQGFDYSMVLPGQGHYYNPDFLIDGKLVRKQGHCSEIITETTLDWLKNKRDPNKPFCVLYHQKAPHRNWQPAPKYLNLYDDLTFDAPENFFDNYEGRGRAAKEQEMQIHGHAMWGHDFKMVVDPKGDSTGFHNEFKRFNPKQKSDWLAAYESENEDFKAKYAKLSENEIALWKYNRYIKDYLRTIKSVDDGVGEVLDYLEKAGLAENTIVVYTSDQGFYLGEHGWFDKRFMYEESFRTPLLIRYPKEIKKGTTIKKLVQNLDFAPTLLDYAGIKAPKEMQGASFRQLVSGQTTQWRDAVYYTYYEYPAVHMVKRHYGISTERYKLMHFYHDIDEWELYDLQTDPKEMKNVYDDSKYKDIRTMMHKRLLEIRAEYRDSDANDERFKDAYLKATTK
jgi:arylsulfatase A-like enzyme